MKTSYISKVRKTIGCYTFILLTTPLVQAATTVNYYGAYVRDLYSQSDNTGAVASTFFPHQFLSEVVGTDLGNYSTRTISFPAGATFPSRILHVPPSGETASNTLSFNTQAELDSAAPLGAYTFTLDGASSALTLSAGTMPNAPQILGGSWAGGKLQVASSGFTLNFATPTNTDKVRLYIYQRSNPFATYRHEGNGSTTSFNIPSSQLVEGIEYGAALDFINSVDTATAFGGATGDIGYMTRNEFTFVINSVPEPSSSVLSILACGILTLRRKR